MENAFRIHAAVLADQVGWEGVRVVAFDGKTLRGSFDHFADRAAVYLVSGFDVTSAMVLGHIEVGEKENDKVAYYVSNAPISAAVAAAAIRQHWGVENRSHYVRDVTMAEDASRIKKTGMMARI